MKKIINGKLYDTERAERIGSRSYGNKRDLDYVKEILYRKKTGELFLYGIGGPKSCYSKALSYNEWCGGDAIIREPEFDAKDWVGRYLDADTYIRLFGSVEE